jgi:hypothetical protein
MHVCDHLKGKLDVRSGGVVLVAVMGSQTNEARAPTPSSTENDDVRKTIATVGLRDCTMQ